MSHPKAFAPLRPLAERGGRGRVYRVRPAALADLSRDDVLLFWSGLMLRQCGSAHAVAMRFDVTEQTGRNWIDGFACPTGLAVMRALEWWPEDFTGAGARMRRAA
ncbi:MAG: hypothetical protein ACOH2H_16075 [Cypionkella sp.]